MLPSVFLGLSGEVTPKQGLDNVAVPGSKMRDTSEGSGAKSFAMNLAVRYITTRKAGCIWWL